MSITFPIGTYTPQFQKFPNTFFTADDVLNLLNSTDSTYAASAQVLFHEARDNNLVDVPTYDANVKEGQYPWYNYSSRSEEELEVRYDCRLYAIPYWPPNPYPGDSSNISSSSSRLAVRIDGYKIAVTVCLRRILDVDSDGRFQVSDPLDLDPGTTLQLQITGATFSSAVGTLQFPTGVDVDDLEYPFLIEVYWAQALTADDPGFLSGITIVEFCASDFPS
jgi:hypothetical protein